MGVGTAKSETASPPPALPSGEVPHSCAAQTQVPFFSAINRSAVAGFPPRVPEIQLTVVSPSAPQQGGSVADSPDPPAPRLLITILPSKAPRLGRRQQSSRTRTTTATRRHPPTRRTQRTRLPPTPSLPPPVVERRRQRSLELSTPPPYHPDFFTQRLTTTLTIYSNSLMERSSSRAPWSWTFMNGCGAF